MSGSVNKVILVGNLGQAPEVRTGQSGAKVASFSVATSERWKDRNTGEQREKTEWHRVVIFNEGLVGVAESYLKKGSKVYLEGKLQTRKWTDQAGGERYTTEVVLNGFAATLVLLDKREGVPPAASPDDYGRPAGGGGRGSLEAEADRAYELGRGAPGGGVGAEMDDEIPF